MDLVNSAYAVETGNTGVAFKNANRYTRISLVEDALDYLYVLKLDSKPEIIGVIKAQIIDDGNIVDLGPIAIKPKYQVLF